MLRNPGLLFAAVLAAGLSPVTAADAPGSAVSIQTFTYHEPFGIAHSNEVLEFALGKKADAANCRLLDGKGKEVAFQIARNGKSLLVRTDLAANETLNWQLVQNKPAGESKGAVQVKEDAGKGWYEITNGLTGVRIPTGKGFVSETTGLTDEEFAIAAEHEYVEAIKKKHNITPRILAPVQGVQLRDGTWTANGPNMLNAVAFCWTMKVEFVERGPFETFVKVSYLFKGKQAIPRIPKYAETSPGYPGGDGHYTCMIKVLAGQPTIQFEEDSDVVTSWRMNLLPELRLDAVRHPELQKGGGIKDSDFTVPLDADYTTGYQTQDKTIIHLMPWGTYLGEHYWLLFNSRGDDNSPVVGVFADKSGNAMYPDASGPGMVCSNNWMGGGSSGAGFNVQICRTTPDARSFPFVRIAWGLYVGVKGADLAPLGKPQPVIKQMDILGGLVPQLRNVTEKVPELPRLNWEERSDWINVKTKATPKAAGNGVADDTAALQAALDGLKDGYNRPNTVYLPPGTYRIRKTLSWQNLYGKHILGHGRDTRIVWDGDGSSPPVMFHSNGATAGVVFEGIVWDGAGKAEIGVNHCSNTHYESHVTHRNEEFRNMGAGIVTSYSPYYEYKNATAEVLFDNCLFVNTGTGLGFGSYNALDNTVIDCAFYYCNKGILNSVGNVYVRRCGFHGSLDTDIWTHVGDCAALRCTSVGSKHFLHGGGQMFVLEDCHVDGWKSTQGAIDRPVGSPLTVFDCTFTNPPDKNPPITGVKGAAVLISNCTSGGTDGVLDKNLSGKAITIPPGQRGGAVVSAQERFFRSEVPVPGKVFDARRDFGAKGDGKADDTDAIIATVKAAREHGKGAIAYLPNGQYRVNKTIEVSGSDYYIGGAGNGWTCGTLVSWAGKHGEKDKEAAVFHIQDANKVTLEEFVAATPSAYYEDMGVASFLHTRSNSPSMVTYADVGGFAQFRGLSRNDRVYVRMLSGVFDFDNCQRATILAEQLYPSRHPQSKRFDTTLRVRGADRTIPKDGFLGLLTMFNAGNPYDVTIEDSQNLVISDYYTEQTARVLLLKGNPGDTPGRVTMLAHKFHGFVVDDMVNVRNYRGTLMIGASFLPQPPVKDKGKATGATMTGEKVADKPLVFVQEGNNPIDILLVGCNYPTGEPVIKKGSGATFIMANDTVAGRPGPWHTELTDAEKAKIAGALDHLRRLGQMDLEFQKMGLVTYTLLVRGTTVVSIDPPGRVCPLFQREYLRDSEPRWRKVQRFVADKQINY